MLASWVKRGWLASAGGLGAALYGDGTYNSSIDGGVTNQPYRYCYLDGATDAPVVIVMHGFGGDYTAISNDILASIAAYGVFAVAVGMRGRPIGSARSGSPDCSGREIHDIYDALTAIRVAFPAVVSATVAVLDGYSGGGGNALAAACKFPDTWATVVSNFGMSDYAEWYNGADGAGYRTDLATWIGGTPVTAADAYAARNARSAIANYAAGHLFLFHDTEDTSVFVAHSQAIATVLSGAGRTNYTYSETTTTDSPRWIHNYPNPGTETARTIDVWAPTVRDGDYPAWTIAVSGTITVIGYIVTKRFSIWLGTGVNEVATVAYNTATDQYTVTPLTGSVAVVITQGAKTASQTIASETTLTVV